MNTFEDKLRSHLQDSVDRWEPTIPSFNTLVDESRKKSKLVSSVPALLAAAVVALLVAGVALAGKQSTKSIPAASTNATTATTSSSNTTIANGGVRPPVSVTGVPQTTTTISKIPDHIVYETTSDFDGDGVKDTMWLSNPGGDSHYNAVTMNLSKSGYSSTTLLFSYPFHAAPNPKVVSILDLNGDGIKEVAFQTSFSEGAAAFVTIDNGKVVQLKYVSKVNFYLYNYQGVSCVKNGIEVLTLDRGANTTDGKYSLTRQLLVISNGKFVAQTSLTERGTASVEPSKVSDVVPLTCGSSAFIDY